MYHYMKTTLSCKCGREFEEYASQTEGYCSKECWYKYGRSKTFVGQRVGRYLVLKRKRSEGITRYLCKCDCGAEKWVTNTNLVSGLKRGTISCGCWARELLSARNKSHQDTQLSALSGTTTKGTLKIEALSGC